MLLGDAIGWGKSWVSTIRRPPAGAIEQTGSPRRPTLSARIPDESVWYYTLPTKLDSTDSSDIVLGTGIYENNYMVLPRFLTGYSADQSSRYSHLSNSALATSMNQVTGYLDKALNRNSGS